MQTELVESELQKQFKEKVAQLDALKTEYEAKGQAVLQELFDKAFKAHPDLTAVKWSQYTPGFNDGDPCYFSIGEVTATTIPEDDVTNISTWGDYDGEVEYPDDAICVNWNKYPVANELATFINTHYDIMEQVYGDGVLVTVFRDRTEIEEYNSEY